MGQGSGHVPIRPLWSGCWQGPCSPAAPQEDKGSRAHSRGRAVFPGGCSVAGAGLWLLPRRGNEGEHFPLQERGLQHCQVLCDPQEDLAAHEFQGEWSQMLPGKEQTHQRKEPRGGLVHPRLRTHRKWNLIASPSHRGSARMETGARDPGQVVSPPLSFQAWLTVTAFAQPGGHCGSKCSNSLNHIGGHRWAANSWAASWGHVVWRGAETSPGQFASESAFPGSLGNLGQDFPWPRWEAGHMCLLSCCSAAPVPAAAGAHASSPSHRCFPHSGESSLCLCLQKTSDRSTGPRVPETHFTCFCYLPGTCRHGFVPLGC